MLGFFNEILTVDLYKQQWARQPISDEILRQTLGGKGLATHLLLTHNPPGVDPMAPENHLIFALGPLTGTPIWGSCRHGVYTKSPQTGFYAESYSGGTVADSMAGTGFDAVVITGASEKPVWLEISPEGVTFHSAHDLWGLETYDTEDRVKAWLKKNRTEAQRPGVTVIGPAGEQRVRFAVIENDYWRSSGRTGVGAVMGAKNVKAIAFWGNRRKEMADEQSVKGFVKKMARIAKEDGGVKAYNTMGTPMLVDVTSKMGCFPSRYWHEGKVAHQDRINAAALHERCEVEPHACLKCFMACGRLSTVKEGRHKGLKIEGPEYETIFAFGGLCEVNSIEEIAYLNDICDRLGMDTISAGNLVGLAIDASQQGKIQEHLTYGDVDQIADLLKDMAARKGLGAILSRGIHHAARQLNMHDEAIHVKGLEPPGYDPRVLKGMGLAYGTSGRGACHLRATFYKPELSGMIDPDQIQDKAAMFAEWEDRLTVFDTLILCRFYRDLYQWDELSTMIEGITGLTLDQDAMREVATRVINDARRFNIREGLTPEDDRLPPRFHREALESGKTISEADMQELLKDYYKSRGWNAEGIPTEQP